VEGGDREQVRASEDRITCASMLLAFMTLPWVITACRFLSYSLCVRSTSDDREADCVRLGAPAGSYIAHLALEMSRRPFFFLDLSNPASPLVLLASSAAPQLPALIFSNPKYPLRETHQKHRPILTSPIKDPEPHRSTKYRRASPMLESWPVRRKAELG